MTRKDILETYKVNEYNIIRSPGKFEGEMLYMPYFYDEYLNGMADVIEDDLITFYVDDADLKEFPELENQNRVCFYVNDDGFVTET